MRGRFCSVEANSSARAARRSCVSADASSKYSFSWEASAWVRCMPSGWTTTSRCCMTSWLPEVCGPWRACSVSVGSFSEAGEGSQWARMTPLPVPLVAGSRPSASCSSSFLMLAWIVPDLSTLATLAKEIPSKPPRTHGLSPSWSRDNPTCATSRLRTFSPDRGDFAARRFSCIASSNKRPSWTCSAVTASSCINCPQRRTRCDRDLFA
mmetsp:Transcript_44585/g.113941  ORF Transcript_44585/g.113941 Transcript_44585/m.113941 type:complete len:209 (-) Transcript_44585:1983-2609(-)